jgi:hypothetical protein
MTIPEPGQTWQDRDKRIPDETRRLVEVVAADDSFVEGRGWWQQVVDGRWQDTPATSRRTRIRTAMFTQRYTPLDQENR